MVGGSLDFHVFSIKCLTVLFKDTTLCHWDPNPGPLDSESITIPQHRHHDTIYLTTHYNWCLSLFFLSEPLHEKTNNVVSETGPTQTKQYEHRRWLEAGNFTFRK